MKLNVFDVRHVVNQIKESCSISGRSKLLSDLMDLLERNTNKRDDPRSQVLSNNIKQYRYEFLDLCLQRTRYPERFGIEYEEYVNGAMATIARNKQVSMNSFEIEHLPKEYIFKTKYEYLSNEASKVFGKLKRARNIIEESIIQDKYHQRQPAGNMDGRSGTNSGLKAYFTRF
jgi:hypothetical protein